MQAILALEDGRIFRGDGHGAPGERAGEVVFNTSLTGYQEIFTDPSYAGQIVVLTNPQIGNYGTNADDNEARKKLLTLMDKLRDDSRLQGYEPTAAQHDMLARIRAALPLKPVRAPRRSAPAH